MNYKNIVLLASLSAFNFNGCCYEAGHTIEEDIATMKQAIVYEEREYEILCEAIKRQAAIDGFWHWSDRYLNLLALREHKSATIRKYKKLVRTGEIVQLNKELKNGTLL
jgi:hypothetical protein